MSQIEEKEVGTFEAKNRLSELVEEASRGARIWITRRGKRVALLSSGVGTTPSSGGTVVEELRRIRSRARGREGTLKELIEEGRR